MPRRSALDYAFWLIGSRSYTVRGLREKLISKKYPPEAVEETMTELTRLGLLDDQKFAHNYARDKVAIYRRGRFRISLELLKKGVSRELIDEAVGNITEEDEEAAAQSLLKGRERLWQGLDPLTRYRRALSLLQRRGFSAKVVGRVLQERPPFPRR